MGWGAEGPESEVAGALAGPLADALGDAWELVEAPGPGDLAGLGADAAVACCAGGLGPAEAARAACPETPLAVAAPDGSLAAGACFLGVVGYACPPWDEFAERLTGALERAARGPEVSLGELRRPVRTRANDLVGVRVEAHRMTLVLAGGGEAVTRGGTDHAERALAGPPQFVRASRSAVANLDHALALEGRELAMEGGWRVRVSRSRLATVALACAERGVPVSGGGGDGPGAGDAAAGGLPEAPAGGGDGTGAGDA